MFYFLKSIHLYTPIIKKILLVKIKSSKIKLVLIVLICECFFSSSENNNYNFILYYNLICKNSWFLFKSVFIVLPGTIWGIKTAQFVTQQWVSILSHTIHHVMTGTALRWYLLTRCWCRSNVISTSRVALPDIVTYQYGSKVRD